MKIHEKYLIERNPSSSSLQKSTVKKNDRNQDSEILKLCNTISSMGEDLRTMIMAGNMKDAKILYKNLKKVVNDLGKSM